LNAVIPVHDAKHLFANVLCSLQRSDLDKILVTPGTRELVVTPRVVDRQQSQVVSFGLMKFGFLLVGKCLLVLDDRQQSVTPCHNRYNLQLTLEIICWALFLYLSITTPNGKEHHSLLCQYSDASSTKKVQY